MYDPPLFVSYFFLPLARTQRFKEKVPVTAALQAAPQKSQVPVSF